MEFVKLGKLCKIQSGGTPSRREKSYWENGIYPWAKISDLEIANDGYIYDTEEYISEEGLKAIRNRFFEEGTLLLAMYGSVGKTAITKIPLTTNQAILGLNILDKSELDLSYLRYWLYSEKSRLIDKAVGVALKNISLGIVKELEIPLPPLEEQKAIAARLDKADQIRQLNQQIINHYDELIQALFIDMFGDPVKNEKGWEKKKLKDILYYIDSGWSPVCENIPRNNINEWAVLKLGSISNGKYNFKENKLFKSEIDESKLKNEVKNGDLLFVRKNTLHLVGRTVYVNKTEPKLIIPDTIFNLKYNNSLINPMFLNLHINSYKFLKIIQSNASGTAGSMPNISKSKLLDIKINYPPLDLQNQFAERVQKIEAQKELAVQALQQSEDLFNSLLQQAFKK
ncbi:restriction endonuclease subunit S [Empedobacter falsenii]